MKRKSFPSTGIRWIVAAGLALGTLAAQAQNPPDLDGDGVPNLVDFDIDNDGVPNSLDDNIDGGIAKTGPFADKYIGDYVNNDNPAEKDIDDDGQADDSLGETDVDADAKSDDHPSENDIDGDRRNDDDAGELDTDGDGRMDDQASEDDIDGDSLDDDDHMEDDIDGDSRSDSSDDDIDGDSRGNSATNDDDTDGDGVSNIDDEDSDGDSLANRDDDDDDNDGDFDEDDLDHHGDDDEVEVELALTPSANAPSGSRMDMSLQRLATGKIQMEIHARDLAAGTYDIVVNNQTIGPIVIIADGSRTEGEAELETNPNRSSELPLLFDPIGHPISIVKNGVTYFTGIIPTPSDSPSGEDDEGMNENATASTASVALARAPGLSSETEAHVELQFGVAGVVGFEVEAESLPAGEYDLYVGGVRRATITLAVAEDKTHGALHFEVVPDGSSELPLDFDIASQPIVISQNGNTFFSGTAPGGV